MGGCCGSDSRQSTYSLNATSNGLALNFTKAKFILILNGDLGYVNVVDEEQYDSTRS